MPEEESREVAEVARKPGEEIVEVLQSEEIPTEVALLGIKNEFWERQIKSASRSIVGSRAKGRVGEISTSEAELMGAKKRYARVYVETQDFILERGPQARDQLLIVSSVLYNTSEDNLLSAA